MNHRLIPDGIQNFRTVREENFYYVDKTHLIGQLISEGRHYFLSRPRRFGKSLLLDTIGNLFEGNEDLFRGLAIYGRWDWSVQYPVARISFDGKFGKPGELERDIIQQLESIEHCYGLSSANKYTTGPIRLRSVLERLHEKTRTPVVVLVDEYDKPILDMLNNPDMARANRDYLRGFYGIIKGCARHVRFVFVTGITMFSRVSLFSGLNNLDNISLIPSYSTICGFTDEELDTTFATALEGLDRDEIRRWYNGYSWRGKHKVYNPYDVLLLLKHREFEAHWFATASPTFLVDLLAKRRVNPMSLENKTTKTDLITKFDVDDLGTDALMLQSGYLTIVGEERKNDRTLYTLDYPNHEVRQSFNSILLEHVTDQGMEAENSGTELGHLLAVNNFDEFGKRLKAYFSEVPHQWYDTSEVERFEAHYASMLFMAFRAIGMDLRLEDSSSHGRSDMTLLHEKQVFVLEFKVAQEGSKVEQALDHAMYQMHERGYANKYRNRSEPIRLVALVFGRNERNLVGVRAEPA